VVVDDPIIAPSAFKHGLSEDEILHAYRNPIRVWDLGDGLTMMIGANAAAIILEIGYIQGHVAVVIVHAMRAREKFLR
jgi:predicted O-methyltransferase YrrM